MEKIKNLVTGIAIILIVSCSNENSISNIDFDHTLDRSDISVVSSSLPRNLTPGVDTADVAKLVDGNNTFALDLYSRIAVGKGNIFFSPYSISQALSMAYAGAGGKTALQMKNTLHYLDSQVVHHHAFNALDCEFSSRNIGPDVGEYFRLNSVNSMWAQDKSIFKNTFLDILAEDYGAGIQILDFSKNPEDARLTINDWVSGKTKNRINNLITPGHITNLTLLVLVNAICFNAEWYKPFSKEETADGIFNLSDGITKTATFMKRISQYRYMKGSNYKGIELLYNEKKMSMVILLPDAGTIDSFEASLTNTTINTIVDKMDLKFVKITLPKFKINGAAVNLRNILSSMGMTDCFNLGADFSGISDVKKLCVEDILHKACIAVDERGTEATAATALVFHAGHPDDLVHFNADSPFIFMIRDTVTKSILFIGRIINPEAKP